MTSITHLPSDRLHQGPRRSIPGATSRSRRVGVLLVIVIALSALDLALTLHLLATVGMFEDNPIVVYLVQATGCGLALSAYKLLSVSLAVGPLYRCRHRRSGEIGAWVAVLVLSGVTVQWGRYHAALADLTPDERHLLMSDAPDVLTLT